MSYINTFHCRTSRRGILLSFMRLSQPLWHHGCVSAALVGQNDRHGMADDTRTLLWSLSYQSVVGIIQVPEWYIPKRWSPIPPFWTSGLWLPDLGRAERPTPQVVDEPSLPTGCHHGWPAAIPWDRQQGFLGEHSGPHSHRSDPKDVQLGHGCKSQNSPRTLGASAAHPWNSTPSHGF